MRTKNFNSCRWIFASVSIGSVIKRHDFLSTKKRYCWSKPDLSRSRIAETSTSSKAANFFLFDKRKSGELSIAYLRGSFGIFELFTVGNPLQNFEHFF